jgi:RNA polymerase sigma-70 factor (ECF subfamily)
VHGRQGAQASGADDALTEGLRSGSAEHAERFVRANLGWMRRVARRILRDEGLADDCVQEAFLKAFRKIGDFEGRASLKTWLHRITVNEALMKLRSLKRLGEKIGELPEHYRIVLMLRDIEEMETAEVARMLGLSESNVKVRLHRARSALKKLLEPVLRGEFG